jgi:hypothetical protein
MSYALLLNLSADLSCYGCGLEEVSLHPQGTDRANMLAVLAEL